MIVFPHAKINLGLSVLGHRPDGYHDIESVMVPIPLCDALEAVIDEELPPGSVVLGRSGREVPGPVESDLCYRAAQAVLRGRRSPGVRMHLQKAIPMGAGLGGGSSDAAHVIMLLDDLLGFGMTQEAMHDIAKSLGSDVPFFLGKGPQLAKGRGEILRAFDIDLAGLWLLVVSPGVHVSTAEVYQHCDPSGDVQDLMSVLKNEPLEAWQDLVQNDLEPYVLSGYPAVEVLKNTIVSAGAAYCAMSGSGSTVFGLFREKPPEFAWPKGHQAWIFEL